MKGNNFLIATNDRVCDLQKAGINISLTNFLDHGDKIEIGLSVKKEKKFIISTNGKMFFLENIEYCKPGGRPAYILERDMIDYILVLANDGPVAGVIMIPGEDEKYFLKEQVIVPT